MNENLDGFSANEAFDDDRVIDLFEMNFFFDAPQKLPSQNGLRGLLQQRDEAYFTHIRNQDLRLL